MAEVPSAAHLLADIAWLKSLATTLANDRDDADDLVQEAWITAWRRQPDASRPMRAWLTKVVRDLAGMKRRSDRRRAARDELADRSPAPATPDALLEQIQLHKRLAELVIELDEPYRSTIIARFVEGRTSAAIAEALGVPAGTVRKRLHEALSRLRAGLDADAKDRKRWAPAALAFAKGGMAVAKPTKLVVVIVAALLLASLATVATVVTVAPRTAPTRAQTTASSGAIGSSATAAPSRDGRAALPPASPQRVAMLAAIARVRSSRDHHTTALSGTATVPTVAPTKTGSDTATTLDIVDRTGDTSEWAKQALATLNKLLGQCYDLGRAEDPDLAGRIAIEFTLVGEPDVGGLLERVSIVDAETTITQQTLRDCLTQQLYALELVPPPDGVTIRRKLDLQVP